jgi:hypothetical protein
MVGLMTCCVFPERPAPIVIVAPAIIFFISLPPLIKGSRFSFLNFCSRQKRSTARMLYVISVTERPLESLTPLMPSIVHVG